MLCFGGILLVNSDREYFGKLRQDSPLSAVGALSSLLPMRERERERERVGKGEPMRHDEQTEKLRSNSIKTDWRMRSTDSEIERLRD